MYTQILATLVALSSLSVPAGASIVSLYIPGVTWGYDVPITASNAGTDGAGHTTWVIAEGTPSGTFTSMITGPVQPFTLVEGSTDAHVIATVQFVDDSGAPDPMEASALGPAYYYEDCGISGTTAVCSAVWSFRSTIAQTDSTRTELATLIPVQAAATGGGAGRVSMMAGSVLVAMAAGAASVLVRVAL